MSLSDNTTALRSILSMVQGLPEAVTVQQASGTFTVNSSNTFTVDIGFKPDILILYNNMNFTGINYLIETNDGEYSCLFDGMGKGLFYNLYPYQRLEGFGCTMWLVNYSLEWLDSFEDTTFSYVAYKIT